MNQEAEISRDEILEPLQLTETPRLYDGTVKSEETRNCLFCDFSTRDEDEKVLLHHLYLEHRIVIADATEIKDLTKYLNYWKKEFEGRYIYFDDQQRLNSMKGSFYAFYYF